MLNPINHITACCLSLDHTAMPDGKGLSSPFCLFVFFLLGDFLAFLLHFSFLVVVQF